MRNLTYAIRKKANFVDFCFNESRQNITLLIIAAFIESTDFVDATRNAIPLRGDSDTLAGITGNIAEAAYALRGVYERWATFISKL
ncbi:hypothetical protein [Proteiniclasticum ruminis]|uniref:hypothetical protein n=1 Tax=Proteiniclasticum ruminis TaxID=398199 RepID=UPI0035E4138A